MFSSDLSWNSEYDIITENCYNDTVGTDFEYSKDWLVTDSHRLSF